MTPHDHANDQDHDHSLEGGTQGIALGFRIFEHEGEFYFAEAEISAYVDEPGSLGATMVFHKVSGIDPTSAADDIDWPTWVTDIDDDLSRDEGETITRQFDGILRQLSNITDAQVREFLLRAMEESEEDDAE